MMTSSSGLFSQSLSFVEEVCYKIPVFFLFSKTQQWTIKEFNVYKTLNQNTRLVFFCKKTLQPHPVSQTCSEGGT